MDTRDTLVAPWLLADGLWESHITGWFEANVKPGQFVVDVGANLGYFTVLAGRLVGPGGRVVAVEAHPGMATLCRRNTVVNGQHGWTTVLERAAWSGTDRLRFHQRVHYAANSSLGPAGADTLDGVADTEEVVEVDAAALDDLLDSLDSRRGGSAGGGGLRPVDVIKLDVEGAEVRAVAGMARTLAANPGIKLLVEWAPEQLRAMGSEPAELLDALGAHGLVPRLFEAELAVADRGHLLDLAYGNLLLERP